MIDINTSASARRADNQVPAVTLDLAMSYLTGGLSVMRADDQKRPLGSWTKYQKQQPRPEELRAWFNPPRHRIGVVCGRVSGGLEPIDFDGCGELYDAWCRLLNTEAPGLLDRLVIERSPSGGVHVLARCPEIEGNQKLAMRRYPVAGEGLYPSPLKPDGKKYQAKADAGGSWWITETLIETRGEGGWLIIAPTTGYVLVQGDMTRIPIITPAERALLLAAARSLNEAPPEEVRERPKQARTTNQGSGDLPGDDFINRGDIEPFLEAAGWSFVFQHRDGNRHWCRPGKNGETSATLRDGGFYVFSSNATPFEPDRCYSIFSVYTMLEHKGDYSAAARALSALGFGKYARDEAARAERERDSDENAEPVAAEEWPDPEPLPTALPPVKLFDYALLPESLRPWIADTADQMQCPPDYIAAASMVCLSGLLGRKVGIRPKEHGDWDVKVNLWGCVVGRPGVLKTPAVRAPLAFVEAIEERFANEFRLIEDDHARGEKARDLTQKLLEGRAKKAGEAAYKAGDSVEEAIARTLAGAAPEEPVPTRRRLVTNDATVEKIGELLNQNPNGMIVVRDELAGWWAALSKEGHETSRAFYLEAWDGAGRFTIDRIGRGTIDIPACCLSILGTIQPGVLLALIADAVKGGAADDGLAQRFQLAVWPDPSSSWVNVDRPPNHEAKERARTVFEAMVALTPDGVQARRDMFDLDNCYLRFEPSAQAEFNTWLAGLEGELRSTRLAPALEAHLSKYRSLVPSLALIDHLAEGRTGQVWTASLRRAVGWAGYLRTHAERIYHQASASDVRGAVIILAKIRSGDLAAGGFRARDVRRPQWSGLTEQADVDDALKVLVDYGWIRADAQSTPGRPTFIYRAHPSVSTQVSVPIGADESDGFPSVSDVSAQPQEYAKTSVSENKEVSRNNPPPPPPSENLHTPRLATDITDRSGGAPAWAPRTTTTNQPSARADKMKADPSVLEDAFASDDEARF